MDFPATQTTKSFVPLLPAKAVAALPERAREVVEYRKSGLSLNHVQGCPLGCVYCIRHTYGLWGADKPTALMSDEEAVLKLADRDGGVPEGMATHRAGYDALMCARLLRTLAGSAVNLTLFDLLDDQPRNPPEDSGAQGLF